MSLGLARRQIRCGFSALLFALMPAAACRRSLPDVAPINPAAPPAIEVLKGGRWLFTYADASGRFETTDKPDAVPDAARKLVRVLDPSDPGKSDADGRVYVTNLGELVAQGKSQARPMTREAFETAALMALPAGESSPYVPHGALPAAPPANPARAPAGPAASNANAGQAPPVTIYGTSWCGACRAARQYLTEHKIPFADKDIERDPAAAEELAAKASKMGIPTDRVPIIDVRGRLLLGFDRERIEALLGQPT
jgi:glutaredoxin